MNKPFNCPIEATLDVLGGKWKVLILWHLNERTLRFAQLQRMIPGVTKKVLTQQLRDLEQDGLIARRVYEQVPPKVEYSLTPYGDSLRPLLQQMCAWGLIHLDRQRAADQGKISYQQQEAYP